MEVHLDALASYVRNLLCCDRVSLFLGCSDPSLRHPLLNLLSKLHDHHYTHYRSLVDALPLNEERIRALCDIALQTGWAWCIDDVQLQDTAISVAVVPLERPAGILGFLLLIDTRPTAFQDGESQLIAQYLPAIAQQVEALLSDASAPAESAAGRVTADAHEQSAFISMVSHELRTPLAAIKGYAGLLQAYSISDCQEASEEAEMTVTRQQQYLDTIMEQANHLEVLVNDLLDISRIQSGRLTLRRTWVDLAQLCHRIAQLVQYRVDQQQSGYYCIRCCVDSELPPVWADPDRVQQVLTNLLENAVKYSPNGGLIEILTYTRSVLYPLALPPRVNQLYIHDRGKPPAFPLHASLKVYVTVRDRGVGIPQPLQSSLFKPFTRLEHPATSNVAGIGLGLYISRKLIEAMDGLVTLQSCEGKGTSVTFTLPAAHNELLSHQCPTLVNYRDIPEPFLKK
ncbi:MAG: HAMP domain-containing histidine kinase [Chloroflexi bacterium]|nr:HAMP domain-containing histidine kinase [Chloroflexota bacterium]